MSTENQVGDLLREIESIISDEHMEQASIYDSVMPLLERLHRLNGAEEPTDISRTLLCAGHSKLGFTTEGITRDLTDTCQIFGCLEQAAIIGTLRFFAIPEPERTPEQKSAERERYLTLSENQQRKQSLLTEKKAD